MLPGETENYNPEKKGSQFPKIVYNHQHYNYIQQMLITLFWTHVEEACYIC